MLGKRRKPSWDNVGQRRGRRKSRASAKPKRPDDGPITTWHITGEECSGCGRWMYTSNEGKWRCFECK